MLTKKKLDENYNPIKWWVEKAEGSPQEYTRGWGNGYAVVPKGHPFYGIEDPYMKRPVIDVNSEITFSGWRQHNGQEYWVIGFDTAHYGDNIARWPKEAVEREAENYAEQIKKTNVK